MTQIDKYKIQKPNVIFDFKCKSNGRMTHGPLSALSGLALEGASQAFKAITGKGVQTGGLIIPYNKINELIPYANMFTTKQQRDMINALQMGKGLHIYPSKKVI